MPRSESSPYKLQNHLQEARNPVNYLKKLPSPTTTRHVKPPQNPKQALIYSNSVNEKGEPHVSQYLGTIQRKIVMWPAPVWGKPY